MSTHFRLKPRPMQTEQDDATLFSRRNVVLAREHLASLSAERRAQLQREWAGDREIVL